MSDKTTFSLSEDFKNCKLQNDIVYIIEQNDDYIIIRHFDGHITKIKKDEIDIIND